MVVGAAMADLNELVAIGGEGEEEGVTGVKDERVVVGQRGPGIPPCRSQGRRLRAGLDAPPRGGGGRPCAGGVT